MTDHPRLAVLAALLVAPLVGCGPDPVTPADAASADAASPPVDAASADAGSDVPDTGAEAPDAASASDAGAGTVSFARDVTPILSATCGGAGCHGTPRIFFLGDGRSDCPRVSERRFVVPFDPEASYVIRKLEGTEICGSRMPRGRGPLAPAEIATIRTWIAEGARDN